MIRLKYLMNQSALFIAISILLVMASCHSNNSSQQNNSNSVQVPVFNPDSAYDYVATQVGFGPRIPNTPAHQHCEAWLIAKMQSFADTVYVQRTTVTGWDGSKLGCTNIIGSFNPSARTRILILAHWDTRPWADQDSTTKNKHFDGADDGGSGVAVILEAAREMKIIHPDIGVDLLLVDVEDYGKEGKDNSYCLGTQYWAAHPHIPGYTANYGICLDMVGAKGAEFFMENLSMQNAPAQMKMFWNTANQIGYSGYFSFVPTQDGIEDDDQYVNSGIHIPTFDVIDLRNNPNNPFAPFWHTLNDNMSIISRRTLKAVGQTLLQVLYTNPAY
ncbi:MAG TPA: M28 family peptidase [Chitinophagaceae bacterium]|nr:M28 family peptidase [Chitinophagaceae bacterium]